MELARNMRRKKEMEPRQALITSYLQAIQRCQQRAVQASRALLSVSEPLTPANPPLAAPLS